MASSSTKKNQTKPEEKEEKYLFYAEIRKGYVLKIIIDILAGLIPKSVISVREDGVYHRNTDEAQHILFDIEFPREKFRKFIFTKPIDFSINLKHFKGTTKSIKRKDVVILFIKPSDPNKLLFAIKPPISVPETKNSKDADMLKSYAKKGRTYEVADTAINVLREGDHAELDLPETFQNEKGEDVFTYGYPTVIESSDFTRVKCLNNHGKVVKITMKGSDFISFYANNGGLYGREIAIGDSSDGEEENSTYEAEFRMSMIQLLVKLPGLASQMQFYAPCDTRYPLKIRLDAGELGNVTVYIKDNLRIAVEETKKNEG